MRNSRSLYLRDTEIDPVLKQWLCAEGSLTQQLTALAEGQFRVAPMSEQFQRLLHADAKWLKMSNQHIAWVRESYLYGCEEHPWVKAKSIFPILSLKAKARIFQHIGPQPIGRFLFQRTHPACERRIIHLQDGWTRQSCYTWHGCKLIVQETFLPSFEQFLQQRIG